MMNLWRCWAFPSFKRSQALAMSQNHGTRSHALAGASWIAALLAWIPQKKIHGDDNQVTCFEEVVYFVKDDPVIVNGPGLLFHV